MKSSLFPEPIASAIILNTDKEMLLLKCPKWHGMYVIPGGHIETGESIEYALKREIMEETGLEIFDIHFLLFQECIFNNAFLESKHFIFFDFVCRSLERIVQLNHEAEEFVWVPLDKALTLPIDPYTAIAIKKYLSLGLLDP